MLQPSHHEGLEQYHKAAISIVSSIHSILVPLRLRRKRSLTEDELKAAERICDKLNDTLTKALATADSLSQIRELVIQHGCGLSSLCDRNGPSVHAAAVSFGAWVASSDSLWALLARRRGVLGELDRAKAALEEEMIKVKAALGLTSPLATETPYNGPTDKKPRKRKRKADPKAKEKRAAKQEQQRADKRLSEAWAGGMGQYKTKADLARVKGMKDKDVKDALERHRARLKRAGKKRPRETPQ